MVPISLRQIKNRIPLDLARLQATNESCRVEWEHCWNPDTASRCHAGQLGVSQSAIAQLGETGTATNYELRTLARHTAALGA